MRVILTDVLNMVRLKSRFYVGSMQWSRSVLFVLFAVQAIAQNPVDSTTFSTDVRVVNLLAVVKDRSGRLRNDLTKNDFELLVDGRPQAISYFSRQTSLPLTLGLLVDTSASMLRVFDAERTASTRFLKQVLRNPEDRAFLVRFDWDVKLLQPPTSSRRRLQSGLGVLDSQTWYQRQMEERRNAAPRHNRASTTLYDAIAQSATLYMKGQAGRKGIILLSDGVDDGSANSLSDAIGAALRSDTLIYSIHVFKAHPDVVETQSARSSSPAVSPEEQRRKSAVEFGKQVLMRLSEQTGGGFFEMTDPGATGSIFAQIEDELRSQYNLGFTPVPASSSPGVHTIVLTTTVSGATVQTRGSYFIEGAVHNR
jgi:VWFA-related protein